MNFIKLMILAVIIPLIIMKCFNLNVDTAIEETQKETIIEMETSDEESTGYEEYITEAVIEEETTDIVVQTFNTEEIMEKIEELKEMYPHGMYWNRGGVTDIPCNHREDGYIYCNTYEGITNTIFDEEVKGLQCLGFASMCSDYCFGVDTPVHVFYEFDKVQVGDQIRTNYDGHSLFVIEKGSDYVIVGECNADYNTCMITWGRKVTKAELDYTNSFYITRY